MKIVGLIVEYNPFHNGHLYHIKEAIRITKSDCAIVVMSGNFVQRGTPAIMPKHLRTEMALKAGAAVVIELPVCYATSSAEYFATGAVALLDALGCVDSICFGSESGNLESLSKIAKTLVNEPEVFQKNLQQYLRKGYAFPLARQKAIQTQFLSDDECTRLLEDPNNILGIEYLKALIKLNSKITPYTITRIESHYHDTGLGKTYSSATAIRNLLEYSGQKVGTNEKSSALLYSSGLSNHIRSQVPSWCFEIFRENYLHRFPVYVNDVSLILKHKLMNETKSSLLQYQDVSEDLANRIINQLNNFQNYEQFCELLKTKNTTYTRISRTLLHILLNVKKMSTKEKELVHYIRILGFKKNQKKVLNTIKKNSKLPIITKLATKSTLNQAGNLMLEQDIYAANLYESVITNRYNTRFIHEYEQSITMV